MGRKEKKRLKSKKDLKKGEKEVKAEGIVKRIKKGERK